MSGLLESRLLVSAPDKRDSDLWTQAAGADVAWVRAGWVLDVVEMGWFGRGASF